MWEMYEHIGYFYISCSVMSDSVTLWAVAHQVPLSMRFSRQEYWSGLPFPSLDGLPDPGIERGFPALQADSLLSEPPGKFIFIFFPQWWSPVNQASQDPDTCKFPSPLNLRLNV